MKEQELLLTSLIGKTLYDARKLCNHNGYSIRVTSVNGTNFALTMDFMFTRINVKLEDNKVTDAQIG